MEHAFYVVVADSLYTPLTKPESSWGRWKVKGHARLSAYRCIVSFPNCLLVSQYQITLYIHTLWGVLVAGFVCVVVYGSLSLCTHHVYIKLSYLVNTCMRDVLQLLPWLQRSCPNECNSCTCGGCDSDMWLVVRVKVPMLWCTAVGY